MSINIFKAQDMLKNMSKQQLVAEARNPTGSAPAFMVHARLAEVGEQEKEAQRAASKQDVTTVAQDVVQGAGTGGIGAMAQAMNPRSQDATSNGAFDPRTVPDTRTAPKAPIPMQEGGEVGGSQPRGTMIAGIMYLLMPDGSVLDARTNSEVGPDVSAAVREKLNPSVADTRSVFSDVELGSGVNPSYQEGPTAGPTTFQNAPRPSAPTPQTLDARMPAPIEGINSLQSPQRIAESGMMAPDDTDQIPRPVRLTAQTQAPGSISRQRDPTEPSIDRGSILPNRLMQGQRGGGATGIMGAPRNATPMPSPVRDSNIAASSPNQSPRPPSVDERTSSDPHGGTDAQRALDSLRADVDGIASISAGNVGRRDARIKPRNQPGAARSPDSFQYDAVPRPDNSFLDVGPRTAPMTTRGPDNFQYDAVPERPASPGSSSRRDARLPVPSNSSTPASPGSSSRRDARDLNTAEQSADPTLTSDPTLPVDPTLTAPQTTTRPARTGGIGGISAPAPITASEALAEAETATGSGDEGMTQSKWFALAQIGAGMLASTKPGFAGTGDAISAGLASYTASEKDREDRELAASDRAEDQRRYEQNRADSFKLASMRGSGRGGSGRRMPMGGFGVIDDAIERERETNASLAMPEDNRVFFTGLRGALPDQNAIAREESDRRLANLNALRDYQISQMTGVPQGIGSIFSGTTTIDPR